MSHDNRSAAPRSILVRMLIVAAAMVIVAVYLGEASRAEEIPPREPLAALPMAIDGSMGRREADFTDQIVAILGVDDYIVRTYAKPGQAPVGLYIGYHTSQRQGDTIHSPLNCLPGAGWQPAEQGRMVIPLPRAADRADGSSIEINRVIIQKGLDRQLVLYWYQSHRRLVASEYWGKVYTVLDAVRYNRTDAALVRVIVPIGDNASVDAAERRAVSFVQALYPLLPRHLPS
jgi:EpsI family protein